MVKKHFAEKVYYLVKSIPKGKVATYSQIARLAGKPRSARVVGYLMRINPYIPLVPCHRVVGASGLLIGYSGKGGIKTKRSLLKNEGVVFEGLKVNLKISQWRG